MPNPEILASSYLGTTRHTTLKQGWNIISTPETLTRPETETFLLDDSLFNCDADMHAKVIANYHITEESWYIWLPCHMQTEARYTEDSDAIYNKLSIISRNHPVYLCIVTSTSIEVAWNHDMLLYKITSNPETDLADNIC